MKGESFKCKVSAKDIFKHSPYAQYNLRSIACVPVVDTSGNAVGSIVIMDPKERKFSDDEIQLIRIFARYIAFEIERDVMEVRLLHAQKMEVIGNLAGGVAHEVRNPLNAIMIFTETLSRDLANNSKYKPLIFHIQSQVDRLSELMKDLLNLGKPIEYSNLRRESLSAICLASLDLWKHSQISQSFSVQFLQPQGNFAVYVTADSQRLQQVFINLLDNAAKHSPKGSEIRFLVKRPRGKFCTIRIIDHGSGIPDHLLPRIFEPFFSTERSGTGLGLSIVKHIVETHGGSVELFNNAPPPGCTVEIKLPISNKKEI
jgi:signal transduction histidine kinase